MVFGEKYLKAQQTENKTYCLPLHNGHMAINKQLLSLYSRRKEEGTVIPLAKSGSIIDRTETLNEIKK